MNRHAESFNAQPAPTLTLRQRIFVVVLMLFALIVAFVVVRFIDPASFSMSHLACPEPHCAMCAGARAA